MLLWVNTLRYWELVTVLVFHGGLWNKAPLESRHVEIQKVMGIQVKEVVQCFPNEVGELLHVVEFIVYNTPGPHGLTPRDIDRRWPLATPLEKELQRFPGAV